MKIILFFPFVAFFLLFGCENESAKKEHITDSIEESIFEMEFEKYTDHRIFNNYEKVTDTSFYLNPKHFSPEYGILEVKKGKKTIVVFKNNIWDENLNKTGFRVLDTMHIDYIAENDFLTIGYCFENDGNTTNIIAIVEKTQKLHPQNIKRAWKANPVTKKNRRNRD